MAKSPAGKWYPNLFQKQVEVFNLKTLINLVCGPSLSGKTHAVLHKVIRHLWETPNASVAMFSKTLKNAKDGGNWTYIHKFVIPEWVSANMGLRYTTIDSTGTPGPKVDGQTRTPFFKITNAFGGESELRLFSLDFDDDIENKIKEQTFSMIYFSELTKFMDRKVLSISLPRLRMPGLRVDQMMWIGDTNPGEEGEASWIYEVFYKEISMSYPDYVEYQAKKGLEAMEEPLFIDFQKSLRLVEIMPEENPHITQRQIDILKQTYSYDKGLYDRYVLGKWVYGMGDASRHFRQHFRQDIHVIGTIEPANDDEWEYLNPSALCTEIITGWDPGDTNQAQVSLEKVEHNKKSVFLVVDECSSLDTERALDDFCDEVMEKIEELEERIGHPVHLHRAWSDSSALEKYSATADTFPYLAVLAATDNRIHLQGVPKPKGSVRLRVQLIKKLLATRRLFVSAHCTATIEMLKNLKKGKAATAFVVGDKNKHMFDALSYALLMECAEELLDIVDKTDAAKRLQAGASNLVHVRY